jgi:hypothetical protein
MAGNSWQQPVSGEPSLGTPHYHAATLVDNGDPAVTTDITVTVSDVPTGTKAIYGYCAFSSSTAGHTLQIKNSGGTVCSQSRIQVNGQYMEFPFIVDLDSSKQFKYAVSNAAVNGVYILLRFYFI